MKLLEFIFHLGVLFAAYNFIWFFIELLLKAFRGIQAPSIAETYIIKTIKYLILTNITFVFCIDYARFEPTYIVDAQRLLIGGIILLTYLLGKFQKQQEKLQFFAAFPMNQQVKPYSLAIETVLLVAVAAEFVLLYFYPSFSENVLSNWFKSNIKGLEQAFLLGFIFKVVGVFFLVGIFMKLSNAIGVLISGKPWFVSSAQFSRQNNASQDATDSFTDYEEVQDEQLNEPKD